MKSRTLAFAVMNKMAVSWFFVCFRCPLLERPEKVLCSLGSIVTCRDRIDATVCISNHSLALRLPRDFLELSGGRSSDGWFQQYIATNTWNAWSQVVKFLFWPASNDLTKSSWQSFSIHSHQRETGRRVANLFAKHFALIFGPTPRPTGLATPGSYGWG